MNKPAQQNDPYLGEPAHLAYSAQDNRGKPGQFDYYIAKNGMIYLANVPSNLADYYEGGFQPIPPDVESLGRAATAEKYKIDQLRRYVAGGDYLEVGPWIGMAAYNALQAGFNVTTLEMNAECVALMQHAGINAIQTDNPLTTLEADPRRYDAITMWHSIEHVPEPWRLLQIAAVKLKPGGVLLVAAPNPQSAQARLFRAKWFHLDAPRHLHLLPINMIQEIGERNGLQLIDLTTDDELGVLLDKQGWEWPLWKHIPAHRRKGWALVAPIVTVRKVMSWLFRRKKDDGAAYTIVMKRSD